MMKPENSWFFQTLKFSESDLMIWGLLVGTIGEERLTLGF
jgi:hypothetical protein